MSNCDVDLDQRTVFSRVKGRKCDTLKEDIPPVPEPIPAGGLL